MGRTENYPMQPATAAAANLRNVSPYHPLVADTFGDWAVEAGDKVTLTKDGASYTSPVHETTLTWNGQPKLEIISNGNEERAPIDKMAAKKYNSRGSTSGIRDSSKLYTFEVNQKHLLYDVYNEEYGRLHACIEITSSAIRALMEDWYNGLFGYLEMTASHLLVQFWGIYDGLSSQLELTRSALTVQFQGLYDGLKSYTELTRSRLVMEFMSIYDGLRSDLELTRSRLKLEFNDAYNGLYSGLEMTASRLRIWFTGLYDGLNSELEMTRSRLYVHFWGLYDGLSGELEMTRSRFWLGFNGLYDGLHGELEMTRSRFGLAFDGLYDGLHGELEMTRSRFHVEFMGLYDGLRGELDLTRSRFGVAFDGLYDGLHGEMEMTRSRFSLQFDGLYDGLHGELEMTRSRLHAGFMGLYDGLRGDLSMTRSQLLVQFFGMYDGLSSELELTRSRFDIKFTGLYDGLSSEFELTRSRFSTQISDYYSGLSSRVEQTASAWSAIVDSNGDIKPAKIQASINKATGTSKIMLSADNVEIDGNLITGALEGEDIVCDSVETGGLSVGGTCTFDINAPIVGEDGGTDDYNWGDVIVNAELLTDNKTLRLTRLDGTTVDFSKAVTLSGAWDNGNFPLTINATQTNNGVTSNVGSKSVGFTNASDFYITVEKNGNPTAFGNSRKLINVPFKIVHHAGGTVGDQDRYASSLASVDATNVYNNGWDDVVLNDPDWQYPAANHDSDNTTAANSVVITASNKTDGTTRSKTIPISLTIDTINKKAKVSAGGYVRAIADIPSGSTKVSGTWSDGVYTVSADPNGQNLPIATTIGKRGESWNNNVCTVSIGYEDPINNQWIYTGKSITVTVPLTDDWSGRTHRVKINGSVVKQGIVYDGLVPTGNITKSGKTVYRDFIVYSDDGAGNADSIILQKNVGIDASNVWNDGYDQARDYSNAPTTGNTSSASMSVKTPKADRTGYDTTTYTVSVDNSYAYIKTNVNGTNVTIARTANTASNPVYYLQESWGTGNDSNKLLIGRTTSGNTTSFTHTITADATLSYNRNTHKYTATGKAKVDGSEKDSDTDTESTAQGYNDGWGDSYSEIGLNYSSDQELSGSRKNIKIYPVGKASPSADAASIISKGITVTVPYEDTYWMVSNLRNVTPDGFTKVTSNGQVYYTDNNTSGANKGLRIYMAPKITVDGIQFNTDSAHRVFFDSLPTQIWHDAYAAGAATATVVVTAGTSAITWDSTNKKFYNYGYAYVNGGSQPEATSPKQESSVVSLDTSASWSNGSKSIVVKHGSTNILSDSVSIPASSGTTWENPSGHQWRSRLTIGGAYRYSDNHEFYTLSEYNTALATVPSGYTAKSATTITDGNINASSIAVYAGHYACNMNLTLNFGDGTTRLADVSGGVIVDDIVEYGKSLGGGGSSGPTNHTGFYITVTQNAGGSKTVTCSVTYPASSSVPSFFSNGSTKQLYWY